MSPFGPSRHFAAAQQLGRFWREADIKWQARSVGSIANDPQRKWTALTAFSQSFNLLAVAGRWIQ
jgi:hypothetical protein